MSLPYFSTDGFLFLLRFFHIFAGVIWIGLLYFFNFVQGAFMKEASAAAKPDVLTKLLPRALWWFRWAALWTMATGLVIIAISAPQFGGMNNSWGVTIGTGALMGLIMGCNVWFVIWPNQKIVIQNALQTASGGQAIPEAATAAPKALLASRTNVMLSIPMLFCMAASRHLVLPVTDASNYKVFWILLFVLLGAIEINALKGKLGPMETVKGVITSGFAVLLLVAVMFSVVL